MRTLTQAEFEAHQSRIDSAIRTTKTGTSERAAAEAASDTWEAVIALPQRTAEQRQMRLVAIARVAGVDC